MQLLLIKKLSVERIRQKKTREFDEKLKLVIFLGGGGVELLK